MAVNLIEYDVTIYPRKLWVMYKPTLDDINSNFTSEGNPLGESQYNEFLENSKAITCPVIENSKSLKGCLIVLFRKPEIETIAHESVHFADYVCQELGITTQNFDESNEHYAYLVGWCAKCMDHFYKTVRSGKGKK